MNPTNPITLLSLLFCLLIVSCTESPEKTYQRLDNAGNNYFKEHNYQKALAAWEQIIPLKPDSPALFQKIGDCYYLLASYHNALKAYNEVIRLQPEKWETRLDIARIQLILMDVYAAEESWDAIKGHLNTPDVFIFHGDLLAMKKTLSEAEQEYRKALTAQPENQNALIRLALCLFGQNKTPEAKQNYKTLTELNPQSPDILLQMSNYLLLQGNQAQAELLIHKAIDLAPEDLYLRIKLATCLIESKKYAQATRVLQDVQQLSPGNRYVKKILIEVLLLSNRDAEAKDLLDNLSESEENDIEFNFLKGKYFLKTLAYQAALSQFQMVLEKEPDFPLAHYLLAVTYLAGGQNNLGEKSLIKCLTLNQNFSEAELTLADLYFKNGNYDFALEHAERIRKREPGNYRAHLISGNIHLAQKEYGMAAADYRAVQRLHPALDAPLYYAAVASYLAGNNAESLNFYQKLLEKNPQLTDAALQYSRILATSGKSGEAIQFLRQAIDNDPENPYLHHILGVTYLAAGKKKEATDSFQRALANKPDLKAAYLQLFELLSENEAELEQILLYANAHIPNFEDAQIRLADLYSNNIQPEKAIKQLEEAMSASPKSPLLANNLAWLYVKYQPEDIDEAMRLAQTAYEAMPENPATADTLGWVYYLKKMPTRASWLLKQAYDRAPNNPLINFHLGMTQYSLGKRTEAQANIKRALQLGLPPQDALQAEKALENFADL